MGVMKSEFNIRNPSVVLIGDAITRWPWLVVTKNGFTDTVYVNDEHGCVTAYCIYRYVVVVV